MALRYNLVSKGYSYTKLFWVTGLLAFFISPVADNLTTALILSTVLLTIDKENRAFFSSWCYEHRCCSQCWWCLVSIGRHYDIDGMVDGKGSFTEFLFLFPADISGWAITAFLLSRFLPAGEPLAKGSDPNGTNLSTIFAF